MRFLNPIIQNEISRYKNYQDCYNDFYDLVNSRLDTNNAPYHNMIAEMYTDALFSIYRYSGWNPNIYNNIQRITNLGVVNSRNVSYSGVTYTDNNENAIQTYRIDLNLAYFNDNNGPYGINIPSLMKTIIHESCHVSSASPNLSGLRYGLNLASINEIMTVDIENNIMKECIDYRFQVRDIEHSIGFNPRKNAHAFTNTSSREGYTTMNFYADVFRALEGETIENMYFKRGLSSYFNEQYVIDYANELKEKYGHLNHLLESLRDAPGINYQFAQKIYPEINQEVFRLAKEKINQSMSIDEYLTFSSRLSNISLESNGVSIFRESTKMMDLYYLYSVIQNEKNRDYFRSLNINIDDYSFESYESLFEKRNSPEIQEFLEKFSRARDVFCNDRTMDLDMPEMKKYEDVYTYIFKEMPKPKEIIMEEKKESLFEALTSSKEEIKNIREEHSTNNYLIFTNGTSKEELLIKKEISALENLKDYRDILNKQYKNYKRRNLPFVHYDSKKINDILLGANDPKILDSMLWDLKRKDENFFYDIINNGGLLQQALDEKKFEEFGQILRFSEFDKIHKISMKEDLFDVLVTREGFHAYDVIEDYRGYQDGGFLAMGQLSQEIPWTSVIKNSTSNLRNSYNAAFTLAKNFISGYIPLERTSIEIETLKEFLGTGNLANFKDEHGQTLSNFLALDDTFNSALLFDRLSNASNPCVNFSNLEQYQKLSIATRLTAYDTTNIVHYMSKYGASNIDFDYVVKTNIMNNDINGLISFIETNAIQSKNLCPQVLENLGKYIVSNGIENGLLDMYIRETTKKLNLIDNENALRLLGTITIEMTNSPNNLNSKILQEDLLLKIISYDIVGPFKRNKRCFK